MSKGGAEDAPQCEQVDALALSRDEQPAAVRRGAGGALRVTSHFGQTPLHLAARNRYLDMVKPCGKGAAPKATNQGETHEERGRGREREAADREGCSLCLVFRIPCLSRLRAVRGRLMT